MVFIISDPWFFADHNSGWRNQVRAADWSARWVATLTSETSDYSFYLHKRLHDLHTYTVLWWQTEQGTVQVSFMGYGEKRM